MDPMRTGRTGQVPSGYTYGSDSYGVQFSDPWNTNRAANPTSAPYVPLPSATSLSNQNDLSSSLLKQPSLRQNSVSSSFDHMSLNNMATSRSMSSQNLYPTDLFPASAAFGATYAEPTSGVSSTAGATGYGMNGYQTYDQNANKLYSLLPSFEAERKSSYPSLSTSSTYMDSPSTRQRANSLVDYTRAPSLSGNYASSDVLDTARGMVTMSQNATRFSMPTSHRGSSSASSSSYYPQSTSSSISSSSSYPYFGSMDSTGTDISSISDIYDTSRPSLPRPAALLNHCGNIAHQPGQAGQANMMSSFNSRPQTNTTKKHKCKICDKRFTRPSSLQTHIYSHTGEKPFTCEIEGCGRQFSVVSNLRRHRKVHKGLGFSDSETISNAGSM